MIDYRKPLSEQIATQSRTELLAAARHGTDAARALALAEMARLSLKDPDLAEQIAVIAVQPKNKQARLMGTISVTHYALTELLRANPQTAPGIVLRLLVDFSEPERSDFVWYLKSELGSDALAQMLEAA